MAMMSEASKVATVHHAKRFGGWWVAAVGLIVVIGFLAGQQIEVLIYKVAQVCVGLMLAYVADRTLFSNAPEVTCEMSGSIGGARLIARAIVALGVLVGITVGL